MKKYSDGKRTIYATERAFEVIYKAQGYKEVRERKTRDTDANQESIKEDEATKK